MEWVCYHLARDSLALKATYVHRGARRFCLTTGAYRCEIRPFRGLPRVASNMRQYAGEKTTGYKIGFGSVRSCCKEPLPGSSLSVSKKYQGV